MNKNEHALSLLVIILCGFREFVPLSNGQPMLVWTARDMDSILEIELSMLHRKSFNFCGLRARLAQLSVPIGLHSHGSQCSPDAPPFPETLFCSRIVEAGSGVGSQLTGPSAYHITSRSYAL